MNISRSSPLSINLKLIFEMHDSNSALFLDATSVTASSFSIAAAAKRSVVPFTTIFASL